MEIFIRKAMSECPVLFRSDIDQTGEHTLTKQSFADECDFNNVMDRYVKTGVPPAVMEANLARAQYLDVSDIPSYQDAQQIIIEANNSFAALPSDVRDHFNNDPGAFVDFMSNLEANKDVAIKLGLLPEGAAERPQQAGVAATSEAPKEPSE